MILLALFPLNNIEFNIYQSRLVFGIEKESDSDYFYSFRRNLINLRMTISNLFSS